LFPALAEELCFRAMPLAHASEPSAFNIQILWGVLSLFAYVLYHPLNGATLYRCSLPTMTHPVFLFSTGILGVACSISYWQSGSIWTAVAIHWTVVVAWLLLLGGYARLKFPQDGVENS
jgi:predicted Abi (CAAX) family protease